MRQRIRETGLVVFDFRGDVIASNRAHQAILKRSQGETIGHNWREWTPAFQLSEMEAVFQRCLAGEPVSMVRPMLLNDGSMALVRCCTLTSRSKKRSTVIGTASFLPDESRLLTAAPSDLTAHVAEIASSLAKLAQEHCLKELSSILDEIVATAAKAMSRDSEK